MKTKIFLNARRLMLAGLAMLTIGVSQGWAEDVKVTINRSSVTTETLAYGTDADWSQGAIAGKCQVTANANCLQFNGSKPNGTEGTVTKSRRIWNTTATPRRIKTIKITAYSATYRKWDLFCSSTSAATSTSAMDYGIQIGTEQTPDDSGYTWTIPDGTNYTYFMLYENEGGASYIASIEVTYEGAPAVQRTVTWMVDGSPYTTGNPTVQVNDGSKVTTLPTAPSVPIGCTGSVFVGWTETNISGSLNRPGDNAAISSLNLFTDAEDAPTVSGGNATYYAVFAEEEE